MKGNNSLFDPFADKTNPTNPTAPPANFAANGFPTTSASARACRPRPANLLRQASSRRFGDTSRSGRAPPFRLRATVWSVGRRAAAG